MVNMYILTTIRRYLTLRNGSIRRHGAKGVKRGTDWSLKMQPWVDQWDGALDDRVEEDRPYDSREFGVPSLVPAADPYQARICGRPACHTRRRSDGHVPRALRARRSPRGTLHVISKIPKW